MISLFSRTGAVLCIPIIDGVFIPVIDFVFERSDTGLLRTDAIFVIIITAAAVIIIETQLNILVIPVPDTAAALGESVEASLAPALHHASMIPAAEANAAQTADDIGDNVKGVEQAVVGEQRLQNLGPDAEQECAYQEANL